jgi:predicted Zn finger-like uncharacterized protein
MTFVMVITCPACKSRYRIDPAASKTAKAKVKCPECRHIFEVSLQDYEKIQPQQKTRYLPIVLIVDDARFFREMIQDILKALPIKLVTAADGNEAWQKIVSLVPQLVMLDLNIPGKSGKEILQSLKKQPQFKHIKLFAMSGVERGEDTASELRSLGADDFISKSFKPYELQKRVEKLLDI